jgi:hypothetical protein
MVMIGYTLGVLTKYLGARAFKAVVSAIVAGGSVAIATCDIQGLFVQWGGPIGGAVFAYLATYMTRNKAK